MTFQQLTYVVEIAKCGSINKAAHKLLLSQSGISTAVRELEQIELLQGTPKIKMSGFMSSLEEKIRKLEQDMDDLRSEVDDISCVRDDCEDMCDELDSRVEALESRLEELENGE